MLKIIKIFLLAIIFVGSTYSVTQASVIQGEEYTILNYLPDYTGSQESAVPFRDYLVADAPVELQPEPEVYTVNQGDNLYRIARNHAISLTSLMALNGLTGSLIHPGDELIVSGGDGVPPVEILKAVVPVSASQVVVSTPPPSASEGKSYW